MFTITPDLVTSRLKQAQPQERAVLRGVADELRATQTQMKYGSMFFIGLGSLLTLSIIGAIVGLPMLIAALWVFLRVRKNLATVETVLTEYSARLA